MGDWERVKIGDLFTLEKGSLQSTKCIPGKYTFITASSDWKTHNEYSHNCEALIYAVAASGSLGRCHYFNGKFISSDLCFILQEKDKKHYPINYKFYQNIFNFMKKDIVLQTKSGTSKESISYKRLSNYKLPYFNINHQNVWEKKFNDLNTAVDSLNDEFVIQSTLIAKLRQSIFQEAIEGKLTADWRKEHSVCKGNPEYDAAALLAKIRAEKKKLIAEGKIRKEKPLAPVNADDTPFALPEGWVWTRLGEIAKGFQYGTSSKSLKDGFVPVLRMGNIQSGKIDWTDLVFTNNKDEIQQYKLEKGDLLFNRTNSRELVGKTGLFDNSRKAIFAGYLVRFFLLGNIEPEYGNILMNSKLHREWCALNRADALGQSNINATKLRDFLFPLPPLAEQHVIVERVDKLLAMVDNLETQVKGQKEQAEMLLQAVLREAFGGRR
jgi:type I restriction enzyme S subunit